MAPRGRGDRTGDVDGADAVRGERRGNNSCDGFMRIAFGFLVVAALALASWVWIPNILGDVIGFGGVILTLIWSAHLARQIREQERTQERDSLRSALRAELEMVRFALCTTVKLFEESSSEKSSGIGLPVCTSDVIYRCNCARIGLLQKTEAGKVIDIYVRLAFRSQILRATYDPMPKSAGFVQIPPEKRSEEITNEKKRIGFIDDAIQSLGGTPGIDCKTTDEAVAVKEILIDDSTPL